MEKTFNLKSHLEKQANMSYEGAQGYFLAQQRAWMNCSKCKREQGKSAGESWQECFDEFQKGDRKMSWLANYASDEVKSVQKESAVDYSDDVIKLAASGMNIHTAVNTALQQRLAINWPSWMKGKQQPAAQQPAQATQPASQPGTQTEPLSGKVQTRMNPLNRFTPEQLAMNEKRKNAVLQQNQNKSTFDVLLKISELINDDVYDSDSIRKLINSIQNTQVKNKFLTMDNIIERTENDFSKMVQAMSAEAKKIITTYTESENKNFFASPRPPMGADQPNAANAQAQVAASGNYNKKVI